jgi:A/G-specific adenine glycosylase
LPTADLSTAAPHLAARPPCETGGAVWTDALSAWYEENGRHHLPWRRTRDPWAVLVSEVMLQQTSVSRVLPRWEAFLRRWPAPGDCAAAPLADVLREWQGLGYPRRAAALHRTAIHVAGEGWPRDEAGLRALPGIGAYTARALLAFAFDADVPPPRDVNLGRVAARAALGVEPHQARPAELDRVLAASRPRHVSAREHAYALFDVGATACVARAPRCDRCPLTGCASRKRLAAGTPPERAPRRQAPWHGSMRRLRGAVLREMLGEAPPRDLHELRRRVAEVPAAAREGAVAEALRGLQEDGLVGLAPPAR